MRWLLPIFIFFAISTTAFALTTVIFSTGSTATGDGFRIRDTSAGESNAPWQRIRVDATSHYGTFNAIQAFTYKSTSNSFFNYRLINLNTGVTLYDSVFYVDDVNDGALTTFPFYNEYELSTSSSYAVDFSISDSWSGYIQFDRQLGTTNTQAEQYFSSDGVTWTIQPANKTPVVRFVNDDTIVAIPTFEPYIEILSPTQNYISTSSTLTVDIEYGGSGSYDIGYVAERYSIGAYSSILATTTTTITGVGAQYSIDLFHVNATSSWSARAYMTNVFTGETVYSDTVDYHIYATSSEFEDRFDTYADIPCSLSDLTGCFKKALYWAFVPHSTSFFDPFLELWEEIKTKKPIGYVTAVTDRITEIGEGTATSTYALNIPSGVQEEVFDPVRVSILPVGFGLLFLFHFWRKLDNLHI